MCARVCLYSSSSSNVELAETHSAEGISGDEKKTYFDLEISDFFFHEQESDLRN